MHPRSNARPSSVALAARRALVAAVLPLGAAGLAAAQVPLSGVVSDATTGPLVPGAVYTVVGNVVVPQGAVLTIQAGAIVKFGFDTAFIVQGSLVCNGTGPDSVWFTDLRDDTVGGDTNGDGGATLPGPNWWRGVLFDGAAVGGVVRGLTVRYGGRYIAGFQFSSASPALIDCRAADVANHGFDLTGTSGPSLTRCDATRCGGTAFHSVPLWAVPACTGATASLNGRDWLSVFPAQVPAQVSLTVDPDNGVNGGLYLPFGLQVAAGGALTVEAGTICKLAFDQTIDVVGELHVRGTSAAPVWFTDERDDSLGGDWNRDGGASVAGANWWRGVLLRDLSDGSVLEYARVRYGGRYQAGLLFLDSDAVVRDTVVSDIQNHGLDLASVSRPTLERVDVQRCSAFALAGVPLQALSGFSGLTASGNSRDWIAVTSATVAAGTSVAFGPENLLLGAFHAHQSVAVQAGGTLTLRAGTICKMAYDQACVVEGQLHALGTAAQPVWFTDERDDTLGGDSNGDAGATVPGANWWRGIQLLASADGSALVHTHVRYGGRYIAGVDLRDAAVTLHRCRIMDIANAGLNCNGSLAPCSIVRLAVERCAGEAIEGVDLRRVADFLLPTASGNGRDRMVIRGGAVTGAVSVGPDNQLLSSLYCPHGVDIQPGASLSLQPGVALKMGYDASIQVRGALSVRGSLDDPAVFTDERDDAVGGDSNGDGGATVPAPNWWRGVAFTSTADVSIVLGLEVRYGGRYGPNVAVSQPTAALREVRSSHSSSAGFSFDAQPLTASRLVAYANQGDGIAASVGAFDLRQVTAFANSGYGVRAGVGFSGRLVDSLTWGNSGGATTGFGPGRVRYSNGDPVFAGSNGNLFVDPLFVSGGAGDLRLVAASPCIDAGDPASPLDPDSTRADMGASWFNHYAPAVFCPQVVIPPCAPILGFQGFASLSSPAPLWLRLDAAPTLSFATFFYGVGPAASIPGAFGTLCVAGPYQRLAPVPAGGDPLDGPCAGRFELDFNAYLRSGPAPGVVVGSNVIGQYWYRYGAAPGFAAFSEAVALPVAP